MQMDFQHFDDADAVWVKFGDNVKESYGELVADDTRIKHYNENEELYAVTYLYASDGIDAEKDAEFIPEKYRADFTLKAAIWVSAQRLATEIQKVPA